MRLAVRHVSRYHFAAPVVHALQRVRLTPKQTQGQEVVDWDMHFENARPELGYEDQHHNIVTLVAVDEGAGEMTITCHGTVDTHDQAGVIGRHAGHLPLWSFCQQTPLTQPGPAMRRLSKDIGSPSKMERISWLHSLSTAILDRVVYTTGVTGPNTMAEEAIAAGAGVCQDHAHIFVGAARSAGIPARYVSGYLMMNDRIEQEATHAWAEAHVDGLGWVGFDVSNGISPDPRYIRLATGRDYREAAPITGITLGAATERLEVEVSVARQLQQ